MRDHTEYQECTEAEDRDATHQAYGAVTAIPWCYYRYMYRQPARRSRTSQEGLEARARSAKTRSELTPRFLSKLLGQHADT